jgi:hypothetical protein
MLFELLTLVVRFRRTGVQVGPVGVILRLGHLLRVAAKETGKASCTGSSATSSLSALTLVVRVTAEETSEATCASGTAGCFPALSFVVASLETIASVKVGPMSVILRLGHLTGVKVSPVSVVFCLAHLLSIAPEKSGKTTGTTTGTTSCSRFPTLALVVGRASVEVSPVSVVFCLGHLLTTKKTSKTTSTGSGTTCCFTALALVMGVTTEETSKTAGTGTTGRFSALALVMASLHRTSRKSSDEVGCTEGTASLLQCKRSTCKRTCG